MKKKTIIALLLLVIPFVGIFAQESLNANQKELKEVKIKTFFHCPNGKALIEKELVKTEGVKEVIADLETKVVSIKYDDAITSKDKLVKAIETIGYLTEFSAKDTPINKACSHGTDEKH